MSEAREEVSRAIASVCVSPTNIHSIQVYQANNNQATHFPDMMTNCIPELEKGIIAVRPDMTLRPHG